jgi:hypothetical protein
MSGLIVRSESPYNAETSLPRLRADLATRQRDFYVRNHGAVPVLTEESHRLQVRGRTARPLDLSMQALRQAFAGRTDAGRTWRQATIERPPEARWSWIFWQTTIDLPEGGHELAVRAWDSAGQTQPSSQAELWNFKGYLCAAWHRITISAA